MKNFAAECIAIVTLLWAGSASADCVSRSVCDESGECQIVELCPDGSTTLESTPAGMTPIPVAAAVKASVDDLLMVDKANCREVDICGSLTMVCN